MDLSPAAVWAPLGAIILANIVLSGDNAIVIALAAGRLPVSQQKKAIVWGSVGATVMRIALTVAAMQMLALPFVKIAGGVALLWIGVRLLVDSHGDESARPQRSLFAAIRTILVADLVMSIENVIAVAGAATLAPEPNRVPLLIAGLATSVPLIVAGSTLLMKLMARFPVIVTFGAAVLGFLAGQMLVTDPATQAWFEARVPHAELAAGAIGAILVVALGQWQRRRSRRENTA